MRKSFFNYKAKETNVKPENLKSQLVKNNRFLDENYNFSNFWDKKDGLSGIDKALKAKHNIKGSYQSKEATKRGRFQSML